MKLSLLSERYYLKKIMKITENNVRYLGVQYISVSKQKEFIPALLPIKKYRYKVVKQLYNGTYITLKKN
jgi:AAA family ATP:ADP antiporter